MSSVGHLMGTLWKSPATKFRNQMNSLSYLRNESHPRSLNRASWFPFFASWCNNKSIYKLIVPIHFPAKNKKNNTYQNSQIANIEEVPPWDYSNCHWKCMFTFSLSRTFHILNSYTHREQCLKIWSPTVSINIEEAWEPQACDMTLSPDSLTKYTVHF